MAKKKQTIKERLAKARAYANKTTVANVLDIYALGGPELNQFLAKRPMEHTIKEIVKYKTGYDYEAGDFEPGRLVHGWGGTINRAGEKKFFNFIGIKGPRSEIKTGGDVMDWLTYFASTAMTTYEHKDDHRMANRQAYFKMNGIDLYKGGWDAWQPQDMIMEKIVPYTIQKKIRQIPFVKRTMAKISKLF